MTVGRFAPSPSGRMHLGNVFSALMAWLAAKSDGGKIILRIEDLDAQRCKPQYARQLMRDLDALGLTYDEGGDKGGAHAPYYQSECGEIYEDALAKISAAAHVYPCYCTRAELHTASAPHAADGTFIYGGTCRNLTPAQLKEKAGQKYALRVEVPDETITFEDRIQGTYSENLKDACGDFVLKRSDGGFAYQLAVVADDARMGVTQVVRGSDLLASSARQIYLYRLLGCTPPEFCHVPLICAADGRRLSKRDGDLSLDALLQKFTPQDIIGLLAHMAGLAATTAPRTPQSLLDEFDFKRIAKGKIVLDREFFGGV